MKIKKCVITIAGLGTRFLPITKTITKEMLPVVDVPVIFLQVKEAYLSGIEEIIFVVSKKNINLIQSFFKKDKELIKEIETDPNKLSLLDELDEIIDHMKFTYVLQEEKGTFGALYSARKYLEKETFALMYGDDLIDSKVPVLKQLIEEYEKTNQLVAAAHTLKEKELPKFGIIKYKENHLLEDICYKSDKNPSHDVLQGRFILNASIFKVKDKLSYKHNELQLPKALLYLKEEVRVLLYEGNYFDMGSKLGYLKANLYFGLKREEWKEEFTQYIKDIEKNS